MVQIDGFANSIRFGGRNQAGLAENFEQEGRVFYPQEGANTLVGGPHSNSVDDERLDFIRTVSNETSI